MLLIIQRAMGSGVIWMGSSGVSLCQLDTYYIYAAAIKAFKLPAEPVTFAYRWKTC